MKFFGIDLGTSKCCVAYAINSSRPNFNPQPTVVEFRVDALLGTKTSVVPSVVARPRAGTPSQGETLFAFEAETEVSNGRVRGRNYQEVFRSVKSHLGSGRSYVGAVPALNTPIKVWATLIGRLCDMTVAEKGKEFDPRQHPTVLTVPASFGNAQRDETIEAARIAGFNVDKKADLVHLIDEPVAALTDALNYSDSDLYLKPEAENTVLVFDFGGGTFDLTLLRVRYDASKPTGIDIRTQAISPYQQIGGDTIDLAVMQKVVWPQVCRQNGLDRQLTATERRIIEDGLRPTKCRRLKEHLNEILSKLSSEQFGRQDWPGVSVQLPLRGVGCFVGDKEIDGTAELSANDLQQVMLPFIDPFPDGNPFTVGESNYCVCFAKLVEITMERAGLTPDKLDLLVLHGGSCLSPFVPWAFKQMQRTGFLASDCKIITSPDPITSVARGAALSGCLSKKYGKPYIQPIVPEEMSVQTVGNHYTYLAHAGDGLPFKKTFDQKFLLSYDGQDEIVVPIYIGYDPDRRRLASTLTFKFPQRLTQSHPVEVEVEIDADKKSRWRFRPKGYDWTDVKEAANPWIGLEPTENVNKLQKIREEIRKSVDADQKPQLAILADEALQTARAGYPEEALALIEDLVNSNPKHFYSWHNKGLIHAQRAEYRQSLESYEEASALQPMNMVTRGNYGTALVRLKRNLEAVAVMREALSKEPSLTYLHWWLAEAFQALGNADEMHKELEKWHAHAQRNTVQRPEDVSTWEELRQAAIRLGRYKDAEEATENIRKLGRPRNLLAGLRVFWWVLFTVLGACRSGFSAGGTPHPGSRTPASGWHGSCC